MKQLIYLAVVLVLLGAAAALQYGVEQYPKEDPLGRDLLYMPSADFFEIISLGNKQVVADYFYLWAIQYYAEFIEDKVSGGFLYLDHIFNIITDLDPRYKDPYRIGAVLMLQETGSHPLKRKETVLALLDKGIANIPDDYALPEEAAWKCYIYFKDLDKAAYYAKLSSEASNAPHWNKRMYGHFSKHQVTLDQSIAYWEDVLAEAQTEYQVSSSKNMLYDLYVEKDKKLYEPFLQEYNTRYNRCPETWEQLIRARIVIDSKMLLEIPMDPWGEPYGIDAEKCGLIPYKKITKH